MGMGMGTSSEHGQAQQPGRAGRPSLAVSTQGRRQTGPEGQGEREDRARSVFACVRAQVVRSATDVERLGK